MRTLKRAAALVMIVVMLCTGPCFAASAAIVSPAANNIVSGDSLLVSVKVTDPATIRVTVYEEKTVSADGKTASADVSAVTADTFSSFITSGTFTEVVYAEAVEYSNTGEVGFYTKQLSGVTPGLYKIQVEMLNGDGAAVETSSNYAVVKTKPAADTKTDIFASPQTGALQFLQNILKTLFK